MREGVRRAVFFDRDGTIIYDLGYLREPEKIKLLPGVGEALFELQQRGFCLVLVSNQSGVGRGMFSQKDVERVHGTVVALLERCGVFLDGAYYCFHAPWEECGCRKPSPGLILQAARELTIDLAYSFMVGDKPSDIEAGRRAGCRTILLAAKWPHPFDPMPDYVAADWAEVTRYILSHIEER
jgi:D-glycero-D-manno-heptose 1,7-bisphosphate phosphatase